MTRMSVFDRKTHSDPGATAVNAGTLATAERRERRMLLGLSSGSLLLVVAVLFIPFGWLFFLSFVAEGQYSFEHYLRLTESRAYLLSFRTTLEISFVVTAVCILLGYPLAYFLSQLSSRAANFWLIFVIIPFWTSLLVRTYAWLVLLQRRGLINNWLVEAGIVDEPLQLVHNFNGTVIGMAHIMLPYLVLPLYASMRAIDGDLVRAAANLGASPSRAFWQVFFPLSLPGLFAGIVLVFVLCLGFYVTPALLGGGRIVMWSMQIERTITLYGDWGAASALGVLLLAVTLVLLALLSRLFNVERLFQGAK